MRLIFRAAEQKIEYFLLCGQGVCMQKVGNLRIRVNGGIVRRSKEDFGHRGLLIGFKLSFRDVGVFMEDLYCSLGGVMHFFIFVVDFAVV